MPKINACGVFGGTPQKTLVKRVDIYIECS
jgi:hypothetical protein